MAKYAAKRFGSKSSRYIHLAFSLPLAHVFYSTATASTLRVGSSLHNIMSCLATSVLSEKISHQGDELIELSMANQMTDIHKADDWLQLRHRAS
jgi:hypothetical protein